MKVLRHLIALSLLCSTQVVAEEKSASLEEFISSNKQKYFKLENEKVESSSDMLRDSWISPIMLQYSYGIKEAYGIETTTQNASISIDQPIFRSGGIYYAVKFAEATRLYSQFSVDVAKRKLIKDAVSLLMQIQQNDLLIKKQKFLIDNAEINLEFKTEQYKSGQLDSTFLDDAIIERNNVKQALFDIESTRQRLLSQLKVISDVDPRNTSLPHLELMSQEEFLASNLSYELAKSESEKNRYAKNITIAKYLPQINVYAGYNWDKSQNLNFGGGPTADRETDYYNYGLKASMPLNINTFDDMQTTKIEYLKSRVLEEDKKREITAVYEKVLQNIENFEKKIGLSRENQEMYSKLLSDTKELFAAGYKTQYDVSLLGNSLEIQKLNVEIYELERQLELLNLYEMYVNEI